MSCWWLFCIVVVAIYCGNLIAFLTVTKDKPPFNSLEELLMLKGEFRWGTLGGTAWEDILIRVCMSGSWIVFVSVSLCVTLRSQGKCQADKKGRESVYEDFQNW